MINDELKLLAEELRWANDVFLSLFKNALISLFLR